jgi:CheY-like chemotaxis protein
LASGCAAAGNRRENRFQSARQNSRGGRRSDGGAIDRRRFAGKGHEAEAASDSQDGLTRIARKRYDLVVCDLRMPRLDGLAFYDALVRAGSPIQDRIVFITGDTLAPRSLEFLESHRLPYLAKPFLVEELKLAVNRMFERHPPNVNTNARSA